MKKYIVLIVPIAILILLLFGIFSITNNFNQHYSSVTKTSYNQTATKLAIDLPAAVSIKKGDHFAVKYSSTANAKYSLDDNQDSINLEKQSNQGSSFFNLFDMVSIGRRHLDRAEITVPDNIKDIEIQANEVNITSDLNLDSVKIDNQNGNTELTNLTANLIKIANQNGDINMNNLDTNNVNIDNQNGNIAITNLKIAGKDSNINNQNGDVNIKNSISKSNSTFVSSDNGDVTINKSKNIQKNNDD